MEWYMDYKALRPHIYPYLERCFIEQPLDLEEMLQNQNPIFGQDTNSSTTNQSSSSSQKNNMKEREWNYEKNVLVVGIGNSCFVFFERERDLSFSLSFLLFFF